MSSESKPRTVPLAAVVEVPIEYQLRSECLEELRAWAAEFQLTTGLKCCVLPYGARLHIITKVEE